jgi:nucleoside-diphosphate-sugar epimerase
MLAEANILLLGATGFVGGTILSRLAHTLRSVHITCLVRREEAVSELTSHYPNVIALPAAPPSASFLRELASKTDLIINASGDNVAQICALLDGVASASRAASGKEPPGSHTPTPQPRLIHLTGPRSVIDLSLPITGSLNPSSRPWCDISDAASILSLPKDRMHAGADQAIIAHSISLGVGTLLISPGQLFGQGSGLFKIESASAAYYAAVKARGRAFVIGDGTATWSWTSVRDLGDAVVFLARLAIGVGDCGTSEMKQIGVNLEGYYFVQTGDLSMMERAVTVSERLGFGERGVESISVEEAKKIHPFGHIMWGCGERTRGEKLAELGWEAKERDWKALMEEKGGERA